MLASSTRPPISNDRYSCCKLISVPFRHDPGKSCRITQYLYDEGADFGADYGVTLIDGKLAGVLARAVVVIAPDGTVKYTELVSEIGHEPDYDAALAAL